MKVMIIGSGGREHALGWKIAQSVHVSGVLYVSGNAGTARENKSMGNFQASTFKEIYKLIEDYKIDLVIPGSEILLNAGLVDYLHARDYHKVFGPTREAAQIETDKFFSFDIMAAAKIPQASGIRCYNKSELREIIEHFSVDSRLVVLKARGLTGGKGVLVCDSKEQALDSIDSFINTYGSQVLVSERLVGREFSVFAVCNGEEVTPFPFIIRDYKRLQDGDKGPNTGGMGSHTTMIDYPNLVNKVAQDIMKPAIQQLADLGNPYIGFLYAGMMLLPNGELRVLEFNARFGDSECQTAMLSTYDDLFEIVQDTLIGASTTITQYPGSTCCAVLTTRDYPADTLKMGMTIKMPKIDSSIKIFHAGTSEGNRVAGGRVLNVVSYAEDLPTARNNMYNQIAKIVDLNPEIFHYRTDIGLE